MRFSLLAMAIVAFSATILQDMAFGQGDTLPETTVRVDFLGFILSAGGIAVMGTILTTYINNKNNLRIEATKNEHTLEVEKVKHD